ncbi:MAG: hypothetical protein GY930_12915 [bacterium]|nr:hypothetical protein [bacterium]
MTLGNHAKDQVLKDVVFVTDDGKSDWWWKVKSGGTKTLGARPELIDEIARKAGVERFHAYSTERLLRYANKNLDTQVAAEVIEEVRDVSVEKERTAIRSSWMGELGRSSETAVYKWLATQFSEIAYNARGYPDFVAYQDEYKFGFEVKLVRGRGQSLRQFREELYRAHYLLTEEGFHEVSIVVVFMDKKMISEFFGGANRLLSEVSGNLKFIVGIGDVGEGGDLVSGFTPYDVLRGHRTI